MEERCASELERLGATIPQVKQFPALPLGEALELLERQYGKIHEEADLDPEGERLLSQYVLENMASEFVFVTDYPWKTPHVHHAKGPILHVQL